MVLALDDMVTPSLDEFVALANENLSFHWVRVIGRRIDPDQSIPQSCRIATIIVPHIVLSREEMIGGTRRIFQGACRRWRFQTQNELELLPQDGKIP